MGREYWLSQQGGITQVQKILKSIVSPFWFCGLGFDFPLLLLGLPLVSPLFLRSYPEHTFLVGGVPIGPDSTSLKVSTPVAVGFGEECSKCEFLGLHLRFCCITPLCSRILLLLSTLKILRKGVQRSTAKYGARGSFQCSLW